MEKRNYAEPPRFIDKLFPQVAAKYRWWFKHEEPPEDSVALRALCCATTSLAAVAAIAQMEWPAWGALLLILSWVGSIYSHIFRNHNNCLLKILMSMYMLWALYAFFLDMGTDTDTRIPLAKLLLALYAGHCFDVPRRKDLNYSLLVGLILLTVGAVLTTSNLYGLFIVGFGAGSLYARYLSHAASMQWQADSAKIQYSSGSPRPSGARPALTMGIVIALITSIIFLLLPRYQSLRLQARPSSWSLRLQFPTVSDGAIISPGRGSGDAATNGGQLAAQDDMSSFSSSANLDSRFVPSNEKVLLLRSNHWCYLRGVAYAEYDGHNWKIDDDNLHKVEVSEPPINLRPMFPISYGRNNIVQIIQVERDMPNLIFAAHQALNLYAPTNTVFVDKSQNLRVPFLVEKGTVYSVVSADPLMDERNRMFVKAWMRSTERDLQYMAKYQKACEKIYRRMRLFDSVQPFLQLPDSVTYRTKMLARKVTSRARSNYQRLEMLSNFLRQYYTYAITPPPYPPQCDVCDYFLFESHIGNCQQFATALTVMARTLGIPARYVTGYAPSDYNPLTGYYEIRACNAHAWVEACLPPVGWLQFEPTPSVGNCAVFDINEEGSSTMYDALGEYMSIAIPPRFLEMGKALGARFVKAIPALLSLLGALAAVLGARALWRHLRRRTQQAESAGKWDLLAAAALSLQRLARRLFPSSAGERDALSEAYRDLLIDLQRCGFKRQPWLTLRRFAAQVSAQLKSDDFSALTQMWEKRLYGNSDFTEAEKALWERRLAAVKESIEKRNEQK